jgi:RNA polymerase sigma-70 factor (ECF subfamily)
MSENRGAVLGPLHALFGAGSFAGWTDGQLLERFCESRDEIGERAFAALVERHGAGVLRVCRGVLGDPHDADDAFQATFLVLARRARSIRDSRAVGQWLLGVAYRVAGCARAATVRRRAHERRAGEGITPFMAGDEPDDCGPVLREELGRLPEKFRVPLMLCYLEELTQEEVARRLGWPIGTVRSRLARGRERLRDRLIFRGVAPTAAALALTAWRSAEAVGVPECLVATTARAAVTQAGAAGAVSTAVAALTEEVLKTMISTNLKLSAAAVLMAGLIATGAGVVAGQAGSRPGQGSAGAASAPTAIPKAERPADRPRDDRLYIITVDPAKAAAAGLTVGDVMGTATHGFNATILSNDHNFWIDPAGGNLCLINGPFPTGDIDPLQSLLDVTITRAGQKPTPLRNLLTISLNSNKELEADLKRAETRVRESQAALTAARARLDAVRVRFGRPAPEQVSPAAKQDAPAASDQERRLRAVEEKLDRLLAERGQPRDALIGQPPKQESVSPLEEKGRRKAAVWQRLERDGFIGRFDAKPVRPGLFYIMVYARYLGRRPSSKELNPLLAYYSPDPDQVVVEPENAVRRMLTREEFWSSPLAAALLREPVPH